MFKKLKSLIENNKYKKVLLVLLPLIIVLFLTLILTSKAFMKPVIANPAITSVSVSSCGTMTLSEQSSSINLTNAYPMSDNKGLTTTPYTFTITNSCNEASSFMIYLVVFNDSEIPNNNIKYNLDTTNNTALISSLPERIFSTAIKNQLITKISKSSISNVYQLDSKSLSAGSSQTFNLRMWLDINAGNELMNKSFISTVAIADATTSSNASLTKLTITGAKTLYKVGDTISNNDFTATATYSDNTTVDVTQSVSISNTNALTSSDTSYTISYTNSGIEKTATQNISVINPFYKIILNNNGGATTIAAKGTPNFSIVSTTNDGMYAAIDDYGTSYYFRGAVNNNWVYFAGFYWRIIRINGDNTVRMIYSGSTAPTSSTATVMTGTGTQINASTYAFNSSYNNNMYVGYMYTSGSVHGTGTNSTIKTAIDSWYNTNLSSYASKIADEVYCNDRSPSTSESTSNGSGGTGTTQTYYGAFIRLITNKSPILTCPNTSDAFTVSDTTHGNGALTYPVGLITADEVSMAGGLWGTNISSYYLYTGQNYWTGSPCNYVGGSALGFFLNSSGSLDNYYVGYTTGARLVVSLKSSVGVTGSGTYNDPYLVN